jgi:hypothetical protein
MTLSQTPMDDEAGVFSQGETYRLVSALMGGEGRDVSEGEALTFIRWCEQVRMNSVLLMLVLSGATDARWDAPRDAWAFPQARKAVS